MTRILPYILAALCVVIAVSGCAHTDRGRQPKGKVEVTAVGGFAKVRTGYRGAVDYVERLKRTPLNERQEDYVLGVTGGLKLIDEGTNESEQACTIAMRANDEAARARAKLYQWWMLFGVAAMALSVVAMVALRSVTGIIPVVKVLGYAFFVGSIVFVVGVMALQELQRFVYYFTPIAVSIASVAVAVITFVLVKQWLEVRKQNRMNVEMVKSVDVALEAVPDERKPDVLERLRKPEVQSPETRAMVDSVQAENSGVKSAAVATVQAAKETVAAADAAAPG